MQRVEEHEVLIPAHNEVPDVSILYLRPFIGSVVCVSATSIRCATIIKMPAIVTVGIHTNADVALILRPEKLSYRKPQRCL